MSPRIPGPDSETKASPYTLDPKLLSAWKNHLAAEQSKPHFEQCMEREKRQVLEEKFAVEKEEFEDITSTHLSNSVALCKEGGDLEMPALASIEDFDAELA